MNKLQFVKLLHTLPSKSPWVPTVESISKAISLPVYRVSEILQQLVKSGYLVRVGNWYRFPDVVSTESPSQETSEHQEPIKQEPPKIIPIVQKTTASTTTKVFSYLFLAMGICATLMSAFFTQRHLVESINPFFAWTIAILMVVFSVVAFVAISFSLSGIISKGILRYVLASVFFVLWMISSGYSIVSTIAGQYNQRNENIKEIVQEENQSLVASALLQLRAESKTDLNDRKKEWRVRLNDLLSAAQASLAGTGKESWVVLQSRILATQAEIAKIDSALEKIRQEEKVLLLENPTASKKVVKIGSFYVWVSGLFKNVAADELQFWLFVFPAVFLDIIATASLSIFVALRRKIDERSL